eukprot:m.36919 g.36919  ORF g.36919 m.36919 type:complete len:366 (-) comp5804_c0_seq2:203-1300(-)
MFVLLHATQYCLCSLHSPCRQAALAHAGAAQRLSTPPLFPPTCNTTCNGPSRACAVCSFAAYNRALRSTWVQWTVLQSIYFLVVMATTVGYGDLSPEKDLGKIFTGLYAIVGLVLFTWLLGMRVRSISVAQRQATNLERMASLLESLGRGNAIPELSRTQTFASIVLRLLFFLSLMLGVGVLFMTLHLGYSFSDAFYWALITGCAVGFGDITPSENADGEHSTEGIWFGICYIVFFVIFLFYLLGEISGILRSYNTQTQLKQSLQQNLSQAMLTVMDFDNSGSVDRAEYLAGILILNDICSRDVIALINERFSQLDVDNSGMLSCEDIAQAVANPDPEPQIPLAEMRTSSFEMLPLSSNALLDTQ